MLTLIMLALSLTPSRAETASGVFEGLWKVTVTPDHAASTNGAQEFDDTLGFYGGKFLTEAFGMYGFPFGDVSLSGNNDICFTVSSGSDDYGTTVWTGEKAGTRVSGEMVWTKADGTILHYTFTGRQTQTTHE